jgi:hypothetical protein
MRGRRNAIVSPIIARFSASVVPSASVTWKSHDLPTIVATGVPASSNACMFASASGVMPARRVMLNAASLPCLSVTSCIRRKNRRSFGFEPGHPPSM